MDEQNHQTSRTGSGGLPTGESAQPRLTLNQTGSTVAYYGDAARVREGFAIALGILGLSAGMEDDVMHNQSEGGE
jgi:hypothetical protein